MAKISKTSTLILFIRHGRTPTTGIELPGRSMDLHLSDVGLQEADEVAKRIASYFKIDAIYASPVTRAKETAAAIAKATGKKVKPSKGLAETDPGDWTGRKLKELSKLPEWKRLHESIESFRFPNGESFVEAQARVETAVRTINEAHPGETVVAVSHIDPIKLAIVGALQAPLRSIHNITIATCSVTAILYDGGSRNVLAVSDTGEFRGLR